MFGLFSKKNDAGQKVEFKIEGMHCSSCAMAIDGSLEDLPGVSSAETNFAQGKTKVTFDETQTSIEKMQRVISETGYHSEVLGVKAKQAELMQ